MTGGTERLVAGCRKYHGFSNVNPRWSREVMVSPILGRADGVDVDKTFNSLVFKKFCQRQRYVYPVLEMRIPGKRGNEMLKISHYFTRNKLKHMT
jgi:hypothetical protein